MTLTLTLLPLLVGCTDKPSVDSGDTSAIADTALEDSGTAGTSNETGSTGETDTSAETTPDKADPFADAVRSYIPGKYAGFGQDGYPDIVLGPPEGEGDAGGLDVLSLGQEGEIVLSFDDIELVDGDGPDLLVFENPFTGWYELGVVAVSEDGESWSEFPCEADNPDDLYPGCAGVGLVWANSENGLDPTDPEAAGGDAFDLADIGVTRARYVRIRDSGTNSYSGTSGGFDLDALAIVNGQTID